jgi:hypothetical protein
VSDRLVRSARGFGHLPGPKRRAGHWNKASADWLSHGNENQLVVTVLALAAGTAGSVEAVRQHVRQRECQMHQPSSGPVTNRFTWGHAMCHERIPPIHERA